MTYISIRNMIKLVNTTIKAKPYVFISSNISKLLGVLIKLTKIKLTPVLILET